MTCDVLNSIADVWFRLGFLSVAELATDSYWVTTTELYQFGDDAAKRLAYSAQAFLLLDTSIAVVAGTPAYALPTAHMFTEMAWLLYGGLIQMLRLSSVGQLFALDGAWPASAGVPTRISFDAGTDGTATLYPNPTVNGTLKQIAQEYSAVANGSSTLPLSPVMQDYFTYALLSDSLGKESDYAKPEVASHCHERMKMYEAVAAHLWGAA